ncbi:MAG: DeoR/GlpR family DNA-binding transcription regulator [Cytophagales bacterium]|nr:DeoR/GlpR family DNA-binding transcription regulator [Cytophagales bacterium]
MTQVHRHRLILERIHSHGAISVDEACEMYNTSPATIRRDFNQIVSDGKADKTWGGIIKKSDELYTINGMLPVSYRKEQNITEKILIAQKAASLIQDGDVVMIDGGTTTYYMAPYIAAKKIRIITNSIIIAMQIDIERKQSNGAEVFLTGGMLYPESGLLIGPQTNISIKNYYAKYTFLSAGAIDADGPSNSNQMVVETEKAMIQNCKNVVLLADHSKFGQKHMCSVCEWSDITFLISNTYDGTEKIVPSYVNKI